MISNAKQLITSAGLVCSGVEKVLGRMDSDEKPDVLEAYSVDIERRPRTWWKGRYGAQSKRGAFYLTGTKK